MPDLSALTLADFEACLDQPFRVKLEGMEALTFELIEVKPRGVFDPQRQPRQAFSALFRGPPAPQLTQRLYAVTHPALGELTLFLVPVGPDQEGMRYQATFN